MERKLLSCQCAANAGGGAGFVFAGEGVLPNAEDTPAFGFEQAVDFAVALAVAGDFVAPKFPVARGLPAMFRTLMSVRNRRGCCVMGSRTVF